MAYLVRSLVNLRAEIDQVWPNRDRRTDGWYADPRVRYSFGHNPDGKGAVHAIDVDKDGIDPGWIGDNIHKTGDVLYYWIWNRHIYGRWSGFRPEPYSGASPHTDHMHFEVYRTTISENYAGPWGIAGHQTFGAAPDTGGYGDADAFWQMHGVATWLGAGGNNGHNYADALEQRLRQQAPR